MLLESTLEDNQPRTAQRRLRIAFLVGDFPVLSQTFIINQITGLIDRGHHVDIYADPPPRSISKVHSEVEAYRLDQCIHYRPQLPPWKSRVGQALHLIATHGPKAPLTLLRSLNALKYGKTALSLRLLYWAIPSLHQTPYDVIHCHFGSIGINGAILREVGAIRGKLLTTFHGGDVNADPRRYGTDMYKGLFERGDLYTVNTLFTADKAIALGCPKEKIVKLPVGIDASKYSFQPRSMPADGRIKLITVARLVEKKGIEYAIRAVAKLVKHYPGLEYQILGDGPLRESLKALIAELKLTDHVKLLGWQTQDEVRELYANAHIFVLSSVTAADGDMEGQGLVLQEAQAMGMPILSTLHNGIPEGVLDGKSGFLVPEKDADALAERLNYLLQHSEDWAEMGRVGRAFVEEHFNIHRLNDQLVDIYQQLLKQ